MIKVKVKSNIKTIPFGYEFKDSEKTNLFVESLDYAPLLFISKTTNDTPQGGITIDAADIVYLKLYNDKFLPEVELSCFDSKGLLFTDLYPLDHDLILSVFVKSNSDVTLPIRTDFRITEFETVKSQSDSQTLKYLLKGIIDLDEIHYTKFEARKGTSYNVIKDIATGLNLGFATNIDDSNDEMTWINPSDTCTAFIHYITKKSFISENSFVWTFIDFQYNLNYININMELNEFNRNEEQALSDPSTIKNDDDNKNVNLFLTNKAAFNSTNKYINKFNVINQSYKVNLEKSYRMKSTWYDKEENKVYRNLLVDINTEGQDVIPLDAEKSQIYYQNVNDEYFIGKIDSDNSHKNYALAKVTNKFNLANLQKMKMVVILKKVNFDIKRFQNIKIEIFNINDMFSKGASTKSAVDNINETLSGFWLVSGINYIYRRASGIEQEITLMRRDLSRNYGQGENEKSDFRQMSTTKN